jgi:pimeloyl-ACP methyl ester carboxylesterase
MNVHQFSTYYRPASVNPLVLALHCSGSVGAQWRALQDRLGVGYTFSAPDMVGTRRIGHWSSSTPFTLAHEAAPFIEAIGRHEGPVHLVGHSYGGGVALHIAARRPQRIASLTLYEPSAFHLLKEMGVEGGKAFAEVLDVARAMREALDADAPDRGAACFIDYWNGTGAWRSMKPALREEILAYLPKGPLDYSALEAEDTSSAVYAGFGFPVMIMRGGRSPRPVRLIAGHLLRQIPAALGFDLLEAGHMGPITHAAEVAERFARHIENACVFFHGHSHAAA